MIRSPNTLDPLAHPTAARQRRDQVLAAMAEEGYLDADTAAAAAIQPAEVLEPRARVVAEPHVVEPASGKVRALHSGADFAGEQFDYATQGRRHPGSALKPSC